MKVLYVSPFPPLRDGIGDYTYMLTSAIKAEGNEVRVLMPYAVPDMGREVLGAFTSADYLPGKLQHSVVEWKPDVVHVQFAIAAFGMRTIALMRWLGAMRRDLNAPLVVTMHELSRESALLRAVGRAVHRGVVRRSDHLIVHSGLARTTLIAEVGLPDIAVSVIPHPSARPLNVSSAGGDLRGRFALGKARILLAFGFIHADKGLDDLIRALILLRKARADCLANLRVVVAGDVRPRRGLFRALEARDRLYRMRMVRRIKRHRLGDLFVVTGYVPDGEVAGWFGIADAAVLPYRHAENSGVEGLARAFNVPVLVSAVGGLAEHASAQQWTFPPDTAELLADAIDSFLTTTPAGPPRDIAWPGSADLGPVTALTLDVYHAATAARQVRAPNVA